MDFVDDEAPDDDVHTLLIPMCSFGGWCSPRKSTSDVSMIEDHGDIRITGSAYNLLRIARLMTA